MIPVVPVRLEAFGSHGVRIHHPTGVVPEELFTLEGTSSMVLAELDTGAVIGRHPALDAQVLMVTSGAVAVTDGTTTFIVGTGQAVLFEAGEDHETRADQPATVVIWERRPPAERSR